MSKMNPEIRSRLAPTPSGFLHIGNAMSFVLTWLIVRKQGGSLHLRIDDLDAERKRPEYVQDIFDTLEWLRLDYDTGPRSVRDVEEIWSQHMQLADYNAAIERLCTKPAQVFACECSRASLHAFITADPVLSHTPDRYPEVCLHKRISLDTPNTALRLAVGRNESIQFTDVLQGKVCEPLGATLGSFIIRRRDGLPAYHLASLVDDVQQGINLIVRGADLWPSTAAQMLLAERLGLEAFQNVLFLHHPLLVGAGGAKLSKSAGADSLKAMREGGASPSTVWKRVAAMLSIDTSAISTLSDLRNSFTFEHLQSLKGALALHSPPFIA
jgi:glutamyl-tRNA synthetase